MKEIIRVNEPSEAHLIGGYLESHGIPVEIVGDQPYWADGGLVPKDMKPTIFVDDQFAERAIQILREFEAQRDRGGTWNCPKCGDILGMAFAECPVCREVRPPEKARTSPAD